MFHTSIIGAGAFDSASLQGSSSATAKGATTFGGISFGDSSPTNLIAIVALAAVVVFLMVRK